MGKYFGWYKGKPYDVRYKKTEEGYDIYIGEVKIGEAIPESFEKSWKAVPNPFEVKYPLAIADGFSSRKNAVHFLMQIFHHHRRYEDAVENNLDIIRNAHILASLIKGGHDDKGLAEDVYEELTDILVKYSR